jgi:hypothetical protein
MRRYSISRLHDRLWKLTHLSNSLASVRDLEVHVLPPLVLLVCENIEHALPLEWAAV